MLGLGLDAYWAAGAIRFLTGLPGGGVLVAMVPFLPILLIAIGAYLVFLSKPRPIRPTEDEVKNGRG